MGQCSIEECGQPVEAWGWCSKHYQRWRVNGDPSIVRSKARPVADRLAARLQPADGGCLVYTGTRSSDGYGSIRVGRSMVRTHRVAYELRHGPIPGGMVVCHHCDNPPCCNPDHLFVGAVRDNNADRHRKGRTVSAWVTAHPNEKVGRDGRRRALESYLAGETQETIAARVGVVRAHLPRLLDRARRENPDLAGQPRTYPHCRNGHPFPPGTVGGTRQPPPCPTCRAESRAANNDRRRAVSKSSAGGRGITEPL